MSILPDSGGRVTLCHLRIANRIGVELNIDEGNLFELFDAQGQSMEVSGTCLVYVIPENCKIPRRVNFLVTPSLAEEKIILGWQEIQQWGILKKDINMIKDSDITMMQDQMTCLIVVESLRLSLMRRRRYVPQPIPNLGSLGGG